MDPRLEQLIRNNVFGKPFGEINNLKNTLYDYKINQCLNYEVGVDTSSNDAQKHSVSVHRHRVEPDWLIAAVDWCMINVKAPERWHVNGVREKAIISSSISSQKVTFQFSRKTTAEKFANIFQSVVCCYVFDDQAHKVHVKNSEKDLTPNHGWWKGKDALWIDKMVDWIEENCTNHWSVNRPITDIWFTNEGLVFSFADLSEATMFRLRF
jgi:hypothetical protein